MIAEIQELVKTQPRAWVGYEEAIAEMDELGLKTSERSLRRWVSDGFIKSATLPGIGAVMDRAEWEVFKFAYAVTKLGVRGAFQVM